MAEKPKRKVYPSGSWAARLQKIVARSGKTHEEFAAELQISTRTLRAWLYGERTPGRLAAQVIEFRYEKRHK